jgi:hypothetical protein
VARRTECAGIYLLRLSYLSQETSMSADASNDPMDFVRSFWGSMGFSLPGMVTPTFDVDELSKRINDLKAVEGWLKMNLSMLQMTIQGLEMQCVTLNTVRAMGDLAASATAPSGPAAGSAGTAGATVAGDAATDALAQAALWPWNLMQQMQESLNARAAESAAGDPAAGNGDAKRSR